MKKLYLLLLFVLAGTLAFSQIGPNWGQVLPLDYKENPYPRQTVKLLKVNDATIIGANTLEELWNSLPEDFVYAIDGRANLTARDFSSGEAMNIEMPDQSAADYSGEYIAMAGDEGLYVLFNVVDDQVDPAGGDKIELAFAPYAEPYDPGRPLYLDQSFFRYNAEQHAYNFPGGVVVPEEVYTDMARYGTWIEAGAYKCDLALQTNQEVFAGVVDYTLKPGPEGDTLGIAQGGSTHAPLATLFEQTADGYFFLAIVPWGVMYDNKPEMIGDAISLAPKVNDFDSDNPTFQNNGGNDVIFNYGYWGSTTDNNVYWAIAYYGAIAELSEAPSSSFEPINNVIKAYYSNNELVITNSKGNHIVDIYNANGQRIKTFGGDNNINLSFLQAGFYTADIWDTDGNRSLLKFVKSTY